MMKTRVSVESEEQFNAALNSGIPETIFLDSRYFDMPSAERLIKSAHERGIKAGLKTPGVSVRKSRLYFAENKPLIVSACPDSFLFGNIEDLLFFKKEGFLDEAFFSLDHSIYITSSRAAAMTAAILEGPGLAGRCLSFTFPLELSLRELGDIKIPSGIGAELVVYGRAPMMLSAQCVKKTAAACDRKYDTVFLKDRTGALMPVKNSCRFCLNTIYNSVPTVIFDLKEEISALKPDFIRFDFTAESGAAAASVLNSEMPRSFTRGRYRKGF